MKRCYIVLAFVAGKFELHKHPVFTGEVAFDLQVQEEIQVCPELGVREFKSVGEIVQAIRDYMRETPADEQKKIGEFVPVEHFEVSAIAVAGKKSKIVNKKIK